MLGGLSRRYSLALPKLQGVSHSAMRTNRRIPVLVRRKRIHEGPEQGEDDAVRRVRTIKQVSSLSHKSSLRGGKA
jgi:hypothetical protein